MGHRFRLAAWQLLASVFPGAVAACGLDVSGTEASTADASVVDASDASMRDTSLTDTNPTDSGTTDGADAGTPESGLPEAGCPGLMCNDACIAASNCQSCSGAPLLCASSGQCVAGCQGCQDTNGTAKPIECYVCDVNHANPIGTCQYDDAGSYCLSGDYLGQYDGGAGFQCECADAGACPGATQVCVRLGASGNGFCLTCGEPTVGTIQGMPCKGGGTCQESVAACE